MQLATHAVYDFFNDYVICLNSLMCHIIKIQVNVHPNNRSEANPCPKVFSNIHARKNQSRQLNVLG